MASVPPQDQMAFKLIEFVVLVSRVRGHTHTRLRSRIVVLEGEAFRLIEYVPRCLSRAWLYMLTSRVNLEGSMVSLEDERGLSMAL